MSVRQAADFWEKQTITLELHNAGWMVNPQVREYINLCIGGTQPLWPMDWFRTWLAGRTFARALSIGCGAGALERDLIRQGLCEKVDAFDGAFLSLRVATEEAKSAGMGDRIRYYAADFNLASLPRNTYDIVFFNQSMHHVLALEKLMLAVHRALRPDGLLYIDEYIGPSRFAWNAERIGVQQALYMSLPADWRLHPTLPLPIELGDPSEAVRSDEILPAVETGFDIVERRDYGGNILAVLFPAIDWSKAPAEFAANLISAERALLESGAQSFYSLIVARPKRGPAGAAARTRYWLEPKIRFGIGGRLKALRRSSG
jgi:SAM-dependent methyltransferase